MVDFAFSTKPNKITTEKIPPKTNCEWICNYKYIFLFVAQCPCCCCCCSCKSVCRCGDFNFAQHVGRFFITLFIYLHTQYLNNSIMMLHIFHSIFISFYFICLSSFFACWYWQSRKHFFIGDLIWLWDFALKCEREQALIPLRVTFFYTNDNSIQSNEIEPQTTNILNSLIHSPGIIPFHSV